MDKKSIRTYPQGTLAAHVLGYYNFDADVASGVELSAKDKLESVTKASNFEMTPKGKVIYIGSELLIVVKAPLAVDTKFPTVTAINPTLPSTGDLTFVYPKFL